MIKEIQTYPSVPLMSKCKSSHDYPIKELGKLVQNLLDTANSMYGDCLGLSANQIGVERRVFVMRQDGGPFFACIDPVIVSRMGGVKRMRERCLSRVDLKTGKLLPGISVRRAKRIKVECFTYHKKGFNAGGPKPYFVDGPVLRKETFELKGMDARVFQHELDHLNGVVI